MIPLSASKVWLWVQRDGGQWSSLQKYAGVNRQLRHILLLFQRLQGALRWCVPTVTSSSVEMCRCAVARYPWERQWGGRGNTATPHVPCVLPFGWSWRRGTSDTTASLVTLDEASFSSAWRLEQSSLPALFSRDKVVAWRTRNAILIFAFIWCSSEKSVARLFRRSSGM